MNLSRSRVVCYIEVRLIDMWLCNRFVGYPINHIMLLLVLVVASRHAARQPRQLLKNPFKGKNFAVWRVITILRFDQLPENIQLFAWWHLFRLVKRIIFKKCLSKTNLPVSDFFQLGSEFTGFLAEKWSFFVLFCFLQLCPILAYLI